MFYFTSLDVRPRYSHIQLSCSYALRCTSCSGRRVEPLENRFHCPDGTMCNWCYKNRLMDDNTCLGSGFPTERSLWLWLNTSSSYLHPIHLFMTVMTQKQLLVWLVHTPPLTHAPSPQWPGNLWSAAVRSHFYLLVSCCLQLFHNHRRFVINSTNVTGYFVVAVVPNALMWTCVVNECSIHPCCIPRARSWRIIPIGGSCSCLNITEPPENRQHLLLVKKNNPTATTDPSVEWNQFAVPPWSV